MVTGVEPRSTVTTLSDAMHGLLPRNPSGQVALGGDKEKEGERPHLTATKNPNHKRLGSSTTALLAPVPCHCVGRGRPA
jgi:hypothetical protein